MIKKLKMLTECLIFNILLLQIMRFQIQLYNSNRKYSVFPINYQYPLSSAIYKILAKGDAGYAKFLHQEGYGKGYKFFTFSELKLKFKQEGDRMRLLNPSVEFTVAFQLPEASRTFIEGLFRSEEIVIADKKSKAVFKVQSIVSLKNPLQEIEDREITQIVTRPLSAVISGEKNEKENYEFLEPDDLRFGNALLHNWKNKIRAAYGEKEEEESILMIEVEKYKNPWRSRLVTIKSDTNAETKIKGHLNFKLRLTAERRYLDLILNAGMGLYSAQGMGCLEVVYVEGEGERD